MRTVTLSYYLDQRFSYVVTTSQLTLRDVVKIKLKFCPWRYLATEKEMKWTTSKMEKAATYKFVDRSTGWVCNEDWVLNICRRIFSQGVLRFSRENLQLVYALETYFRHVRSFRHPQLSGSLWYTHWKACIRLNSKTIAQMFHYPVQLRESFHPSVSFIE